MKFAQYFRAAVVFSACGGLLLPASHATAANSEDDLPNNAARATGEDRTIHDVALEPDGTAIGMVVDLQGAPLADKRVVAYAGRREVARVRTDASGRFILGPMRGGVYQVQVDDDGHLFRMWSAGTEPASAKRGMLIVTRGDVLRGQRPIGQLFTSNVFIVTAVVAAAVAIPIAVANSKSERGPSS